MKWNIVKQGSAVLSLLLIVGSSNVQANAIGTSIIQVQNLVMKNVNTDTVIEQGVDFQFSGAGSTNDADVVANLSAHGTDSGVVTGSAPGVPIDLYACVGDCAAAPADNAFATKYPPFDQYAASDANLSGTIATLDPDNDPSTPNPVSTGANASLLNEVSLSTTSNGSGQSNVGTISEVSFTALTNAALEISFDASIYLRALLSDDANLGFGVSGVNAGVAWSVSLIGLSGAAVGQSFSWSPDGQAGGIIGATENADACNLQTSVGTLNPAFPALVTCNGAFKATTSFALVSGEAYFFQVNQLSTADALVEVPEPAVTFLLGAGLLAMVFAARRRRLKFEA